MISNEAHHKYHKHAKYANGRTPRMNTSNGPANRPISPRTQLSQNEFSQLSNRDYCILFCYWRLCEVHRLGTLVHDSQYTFDGLLTSDIVAKIALML